MYRYKLLARKWLGLNWLSHEIERLRASWGN